MITRSGAIPHETRRTLQAVLNEKQPDSPVYTYLSQLVPPYISQQAEKTLKQVAATVEGNRSRRSTNKTLALLAAQGELALKQRKYSKAKILFGSALLIGNSESDTISSDSCLIHRLALATYKAEEPDTVSALKEAIGLLHRLDLDHTNDPETVALAGAIEKRFYEKDQGDQHLLAGILYYQRSFYLLHNRYNGINVAYLLTCKAHSPLCSTAEDKIADTIYANRTWREVLTMCERDLNEIIGREQRTPKSITGNDALSNTQTEMDTEQKFWILANKAEAHLGLGEMEAYRAAYEAAKAVAHQKWIMDAFDAHLFLLKS